MGGLPEQRMHLVVKGRMVDVNFLLRNLYYDADEQYQVRCVQTCDRSHRDRDHQQLSITLS